MPKASGAVIIELLGNRGDPVRYTVANANKIDKGDLVFLVDPRTVSGGANITATAAAGVAAMDKAASDGITSISVYTNGIFDIGTGVNGVGIGSLVMLSGGNRVVAMTAAQFLSGMCFAKALETADNAEVAAYKLFGV